MAWYHRHFVELGNTMFKEEFPNPDYSSPEAVDTESLCNLLREKMIEYFTGTVSGFFKPQTILICRCF